MMGTSETAPDYGVFNFTQLFHDALNFKKPIKDMEPKKSIPAPFIGQLMQKKTDFWLKHTTVVP